MKMSRKTQDIILIALFNPVTVSAVIIVIMALRAL
jgi:hypothetical protein